MLVMVLTVVAILIALATKCIASVGTIEAVVLFLGLEGTALLASAFSAPHNEIKVERPKGILKALLWSFTEGRSLHYPINYNPVLFYSGLVALALSMMLSTIF